MTSIKNAKFQAALKSYIVAYGLWREAWVPRMQALMDGTPELEKARQGTNIAYEVMQSRADVLKLEFGFDVDALMFPKE